MEVQIKYPSLSYEHERMPDLWPASVIARIMRAAAMSLQKTKATDGADWNAEDEQDLMAAILLAYDINEAGGPT